jgi:hypothetical protein
MDEIQQRRTVRKAGEVGKSEQDKERLRESSIGEGEGGQETGDNKVLYRGEIIWLNQFTSLRYKQIKLSSFPLTGIFCF